MEKNNCSSLLMCFCAHIDNFFKISISKYLHNVWKIILKSQYNNISYHVENTKH